MKSLLFFVALFCAFLPQTAFSQTKAKASAPSKLYKVLRWNNQITTTIYNAPPTTSTKFSSEADIRFGSDARRQGFVIAEKEPGKPVTFRSLGDGSVSQPMAFRGAVGRGKELHEMTTDEILAVLNQDVHTQTATNKAEMRNAQQKADLQKVNTPNAAKIDATKASKVKAIRQ